MLDGEDRPDLEADLEDGPPVDDAADAPKAPAPKPRKRSIFEDRTVRRMGFAALGLVIVYLLLIVGAISAGLLGQSRPIQTAAERDLRMYEDFIKQGSNSEDVWSRYANALIRTRQYGKAQQAIDQARKAGFVDPRRQYLALSQVNLDVARKDWNRVIADADAGMAALKKQFDADWDDYRATGGMPTVMTATGLGDNYYGMLYAKAKALQELKKTDEAIKALDEYLKEKNTDADVLEWRGDLHSAAGDKKKALKDYKAARQFLSDPAAIDEKIKGLGADK